MENIIELLKSTNVPQTRTIDMVFAEKKDYFIEKIEELLEDADYSVDRYATIKNLNLWCENKSRLFNLLKTSEYWNEKELCVELPIKFKRQANLKLVNEILFYLRNVFKVRDYYRRNVVAALINLITYCNKNDLTIDTSNIYLHYPQVKLEEYSSFVTQVHDDFVKRFHIRNGMKLSKVINKVITESGCNIDLNLSNLSHCPEINGVNKKREDGSYETIWDYTYNQWYAIVSDLLNPKEIDMTMYISINPMDYLTQSHGYNWHSCHSLRDTGCYHSATMTMLTDTSTLIVYALPRKQESDYWSYDKLVRCSMFIGEHFNCILQNKLYPSKDMENSKQVREYIEKLCADYLQVENTWLIPSLKDVNINIDDYLGYCDWTCSGKEYACAKLKNDMHEYNIKIGNKAYCVNDDCKFIFDTGTLGDTKGCCCHCCEEYFDEEDMTYIERYDIYVCSHCLDTYYVWCCDTERYISQDDAYYAEDNDCYYEEEDSVYYCEHCGYYYRNHHNVNYVEDIGYVCKDCLEYSGNYHLCECGFWYADGDCTYNDYLEVYQCYNCFEEWCNDHKVRYIDGDYFNAETGELIEDIDDYIFNQ